MTTQTKTLTKPEIITCQKFGNNSKIRHGFFKRIGGVSEGIYSSLNCGPGSKDNPDNVKKNRDIAVNTFTNAEIVDSENLHTLYQIHSNKVVTIIDKFEERPQADALVTNKPGMVLGILTADCTPVLFSDENAKIIGAAHAGWKGACGGILENTVAEMVRLGSRQDNIKAVIGPTIRQKSYEVGAEFYDRFLEFSSDNSVFFIPSKKDDHYMFDLPAYVASRLNNMGLKQVTDVGLDTCSDKESFFSYRRSCLNNEGDYGRNLSVIMLDT